MARDEARHVGALDLVTTVLDEEGMLDQPSPISLDDATIVRLRELLDAIAARRRPRDPIERALDIALEVEETELEDLVCDLLKAVQTHASTTMPAAAGPRPGRPQLHDRTVLRTTRRCSSAATRWLIVTPRPCATLRSDSAFPIPEEQTPKPHAGFGLPVVRRKNEIAKPRNGFRSPCSRTEV